MTQLIEFDREKLKRLKGRYDRAVINNEKTFQFDGGDYLTTYAKYLIEHLENELGVDRQDFHLH